MPYQQVADDAGTESHTKSTIAGGPDPGEISDCTFWMLILLLTACAALVRFYHLGDKSLWIDEGGSWILTQMSWHAFCVAIRTCMAEMTLYYFLLRLWSTVGTSEFALRSLSVLLSVATVPLVGYLGRRLFTRQAGILAAAVFSFHVWNISFAREARTYPLLTLLLVIGWLLIARIVQEPTPRNWAWFGIVSVLAVYSHFLAALTIAAQFTTLLLIPMNRREFKRLIGAGLWIVVGCLPVILYALRQSAGTVSWAKPTTFSMRIPFHTPDYRVESASGNVAYLLDFLSGWWSRPFVIYGFCVIVAVLVGLFLARWRANGRSRSTWAGSVPVLGMIIPVLGLLAISMKQPAFVARYLMPTVVPLALGIGWLGARLRKQLWVVAVIAISAFLLKPLPGYVRRPPYQDFRGAAEYIGKHAQTGDVIYIWEPFARPALEYYGQRIHGFPAFVYPDNNQQFRGLNVAFPDPWGVPPEMARHKRIWIVYNFALPAEKVGTVPFFYQRAAEHTGHRMISSFYSENMQALEFVRDPAGTTQLAQPNSASVSKVVEPSAPSMQLPTR